MRRSVVSGLVFATSALVLAAMSPACGGTSGQGGFPTGPTGATGTNASDGGGQTGSTGSTGTTLPQPDASTPNNPPPGADAGCATATAAATKEPVSMLFILDGSGSMNQNNKWTAATGALTTIFNDMASKNDPGLYAGLIIFSDQNDSTSGSGPYPTATDVPIAQVNATQGAALVARYGGGDTPQNGTPTGTAMSGGYTELEAFTGGGASAKKVLILITDGVPTDNCAPNPLLPNYTSNACIVQAASELTKTPPAGPIETFAIGVGVFPDIDPSFLGYLAQSGGSGPKGCNPTDATTGAADLCYFQVDPSGSSTATQTAFENAINAIRGQVLSCTFGLDLKTDAGTLDPSEVNVTVNGVTIGQDPTNGWTYDNPQNPTSVTLHGTACATVTSTPNATVSIVLGCSTYKPPPQ
jgi:hypothetical protein